jgi:hypothetical protein
VAQADLRPLYAPRSDATTEGELSALANAYRFILLECGDKNKTATSSLSHSDGTMVKNTEEVSHVDQCPD